MPTRGSGRGCQPGFQPGRVHNVRLSNANAWLKILSEALSFSTHFYWPTGSGADPRGH